jgi:hypothetical protein
MIDAPCRPAERFPQRKETIVGKLIAKQLETWKMGSGDLALCGGARGGDILFAELCADRAATVWLFLALPENEFLEESVRLPDTDWEQRFFALRDRPEVKVAIQSKCVKPLPQGASVFARNNLWMIKTARAEAKDPKHLYGLLVWDEKPTGDGPGGTSDFAARIKRSGGRLAPIVNPMKLYGSRRTAMCHETKHKTGKDILQCKQQRASRLNFITRLKQERASSSGLQ